MKVWSGMVFSESLCGREEEIIEKLKNSQYPDGLEVLFIPGNRSHPMDICAAKLLFQPYYRNSDAVIIGASESREEAEELAGRILKSVHAASGKFDLSGLFSEEELL